jgi:hypothetical protein
MRVLGKAVVILAWAVALGSAEPWKLDSEASLVLTQTAYSDNWTGGEAGSVAWTFNWNAVAQRQLHPRLANRTELKLAFGQSHTQDKETKKWAAPEKATDLIDLESVFSFPLGWAVDPYAGLRLISQFLDRSDPTKERFFNPLTFTESVGATRKLIVTETTEWRVRTGLALRQTVNRDVLEASSGTRKTETSQEGGFELVMDLKTPIKKDQLEWTNKLTVFQALATSQDKANDDWKSPDINWENILTANIAKYVVVTLYTQFLYDKEIDAAGRFKQTLSLGLTYKISR